MENYQFILNAISTVGFPIVMCGVMLYIYHTTLKEIQKSVDSMSQSVALMTTAVDNLKDTIGFINSRRD